MLDNAWELEVLPNGTRPCDVRRRDACVTKRNRERVRVPPHRQAVIDQLDTDAREVDFPIRNEGEGFACGSDLR